MLDGQNFIREVADIRLRRNIYMAFFAVSTLIVILTVIASITGTSGTEQSVFKSVWVVLVFAFFVAIQIICLFSIKIKFTRYQVGFYLLHIGLVLFLTGSFVYYIIGDKLSVSIPVDATATYNQIKRMSKEEGQSEYVKLDFDVGVSDFKVEKYEAEEGKVAQDKYYEATLMIVPEGTRDVTNLPLVVNKPYRIDGWKIYLMGYDGTTGTTVSLLFKRDPAEFVSTTGLWMIIVGAVIMCLLRKRKEKETDA